MYSQNNEEEILLKYFGSEIGTLLSIGENNGQHLSNVYQLLLNGWHGVLVEPSEDCFEQLVALHDGNEKVVLVKAAIGEENGEQTFYESGELLNMGDKSLVSSLVRSETERWRGANIDFEEKKVAVVTFKKLLNDSPFKTFDLISTDVEGMDWEVLQQMNLHDLGCRCIILEHNSIAGMKEKMYQYCATFGLTKILLTNAENIIVAK